MKLKLGLVVGLGVLASWSTFELVTSNAPSRGKVALHNRVWVDHLPTKPDDLSVQLALATKSGRSIGLVSQTSVWRLWIERLRWSTKGDQLTMEFPQLQSKVTVRYRVFDCKGKAPRPFDLCLELTHKEGSIMLYSKRNRPWRRAESLEVMLDEPTPETSAFDENLVESIPAWLR